MEIKIEGNPGTGNTFQDIHIGKVENYNPNATIVNNNYYGTQKPEGRGKNPEPQPRDIVEIAPIRDQILLYVSCLSGFVKDEWKSHYQEMWAEILDLEKVVSVVYNPGKQQGTNFNRNLVANIIHYLDSQGVFTEYNAAQFAEKLEGDKDHSVRSALGNNPSEEITSRLNYYFHK